MVRLCLHCREEMVRHPGERRADFLARSYCGKVCSVADRTRKAEERRAALDRADAGEVDDFDRDQLLKAAMRAAPSVPATALTRIIVAVEPLIAMNTRRRTLAPIAHQIRAARET